MSDSTSSAEAITRASKSNLALAFFSLPAQRRRDIKVFYAFCRIVDDIADGAGSIREKYEGLERWERAVELRTPGEPELAQALREVIARYGIARAHFHEIIAGVRMDVEPAGFDTWEELRVYCYRVASAVGLVSIEIFGYRDPRCREYATNLGLALQLTNILRDVGQDFANGGRIYLPREELARFGIAPADLARGVHDERLVALMEFQAARARAHFAAAERALPPEEKRSMVAAEIMRRVYQRLLRRMERDHFHVFGRRYAVSPLEKILAIVKSIL
jgi:phytoene synthase